MLEMRAIRAMEQLVMAGSVFYVNHTERSPPFRVESDDYISCIENVSQKMSSNSSDPLRNGSIFRMSLSSLRSPLPLGMAATSPPKPWASSSPRTAGGMQRPKPQYGIEATAGAPFDRANTSMKFNQLYLASPLPLAVRNSLGVTDASQARTAPRARSEQPLNHTPVNNDSSSNGDGAEGGGDVGSDHNDTTAATGSLEAPSSRTPRSRSSSEKVNSSTKTPSSNSASSKAGIRGSGGASSSSSTSTSSGRKRASSSSADSVRVQAAATPVGNSNDLAEISSPSASFTRTPDGANGQSPQNSGKKTANKSKDDIEISTLAAQANKQTPAHSAGKKSAKKSPAATKASTPSSGKTPSDAKNQSPASAPASPGISSAKKLGRKSGSKNDSSSGAMISAGKRSSTKPRSSEKSESKKIVLRPPLQTTADLADPSLGVPTTRSGRKSIPVLDWWRSQRRSSSATGNEVVELGSPAAADWAKPVAVYGMGPATHRSPRHVTLGVVATAAASSPSASLPNSSGDAQGSDTSSSSSRSSSSSTSASNTDTTQGGENEVNASSSSSSSSSVAASTEASAATKNTAAAPVKTALSSSSSSSSSASKTQSSWSLAFAADSTLSRLLSGLAAQHPPPTTSSSDKKLGKKGASNNGGSSTNQSSRRSVAGDKRAREGMQAGGPKKVARAGDNGGAATPEATNSAGTSKSKTSSSRALIGRSVRKLFAPESNSSGDSSGAFEAFNGQVVGFNGTYWAVRYDDGDEEDLSWEELDDVLLPEDDDDDEDEDGGKTTWTKAELQALRLARMRIAPDRPDYWPAVAQRVGKTAAQCHAKWFEVVSGADENDNDDSNHATGSSSNKSPKRQHNAKSPKRSPKETKGSQSSAKKETPASTAKAAATATGKSTAAAAEDGKNGPTNGGGNGNGGPRSKQPNKRAAAEAHATVTAEDIFANNGGTLAHLGDGRSGKRIAASSSLLEFGEHASHRNSRAEDSMSSNDSDDEDDDDEDDDDKLLANAVSAAAHHNKHKSSLNTKGSVLLSGVLAGGKPPANQQPLQPQPTAKAVQALRKTLKKGLSSFATNPKPDAAATMTGKAGMKGGGVGNSSSHNGRSMVSASALEGRFVAAGSLSSGGSLAGLKPINERAQRSAAASLRALDSDQELSDSDIDEELKIVQPPAHIRAGVSATAASSDEEEVF